MEITRIMNTVKISFVFVYENTMIFDEKKMNMINSHKIARRLEFKRRFKKIKMVPESLSITSTTSKNQKYYKW